MDHIVVQNMETMDNPRVFLDGSQRAVSELPSLVVGRGVYRPGWQWSAHAGPQTRGGSGRHIGLIESGHMTIQAADGSKLQVGPGDVFEVGPGHDAWVMGDESCIALDFESRSRREQ